jgi:hypothetical protein
MSNNHQEGPCDTLMMLTLKKGNIKDCEKCEKIGSRWVRLRLFNIRSRRIL